MAELNLLTFTEGRDRASSSDGWEVWYPVNTLGGNDVVLGKTKADSGIGVWVSGSYSLYTDAGDDAVTGTSTGADGTGIWIGYNSILNTGVGKDVVSGTGGLWGIKIEGGNQGLLNLNTDADDDSVTGTSTSATGTGIRIESGGNLVTGAGNDVVTGKGLARGIFVSIQGILDTGPGNDVIDALQGGFDGIGGSVYLGEDNDTLKGFGAGYFYGDASKGSSGTGDAIMFGEGIYTVSSTFPPPPENFGFIGFRITKTTLGGVPVGGFMYVADFEQFGGTKGTLFNLTDGTLTVSTRGYGSLA